MDVAQIYEITNVAVEQAVGDKAVLKEDLSNVVDVGEAVINADAMDNYVKSLVNHIGKVVFVNRVYEGEAPSILVDGWEYGSILQKIKFELPEATENESWKLEDGKSYDPNVFNSPKVSAKFFNSRTTFEIPISITEMQVKESFSSAEELAGFISGLETSVQNALTMRFDELIKKAINSLTADTLHDAFEDGEYAGKTSARAINLLHLYQQEKDETLTDPKEALTDPEFIRFASSRIDLMMGRLRTASKLFNIGKEIRFTPKDDLRIIMLQEFVSNAKVYLQSDTFNKDLVALPEAETVQYWQGSGLGYEFDETSKINVVSGNNNEVEADGILAVMFDRHAVAVANQNQRTTTNYNPRGEFFNNWYKADAMYLNDTDENFIVFYVK